MYLVFKKLMYTSAESIILSMTYKQMQFRHVAGTVHKIPFVPSMIPDIVPPDFMLVPSLSKGLFTSALSLKYFPSGGIRKQWIGESGSKMQLGIS